MDEKSNESMNGNMIHELKERVKELLEEVSDREREVLDLRFGLVDGTTYTLADVAKRLKISRERVRQIEENALKKIRNFISKQKTI